MSYTTLFKVPESGEIETYREYRNAFRSAWLVWDTMAKLYLAENAAEFIIKGIGAMQPVWDLWKDPNVPDSHRLVMAATFDTVMVKRENLERLADAFDTYSRAVEDAGHIPAQTEALRELAQDETCFAVCWIQTSVNADAWMVPEPNDESRIYDVSRDTGHWFLFNEFEKQKDAEKT